MRTVISKAGVVIYSSEHFLPMSNGELIFIDTTCYRVKEKSLHITRNILLIEVE